MDSKGPKTVRIPLKEFRHKCDKSFGYFAAWKTDCGDDKRPDGNPMDFFDEFHIDVCNFIQFGGNRKLLCIPRGFIKSHIGARLYPVWKAVLWADHRTLIGGNTSFNAKKRVNEAKSIIEEPDFKHAFPERVPNFHKTRWSDECACIERPTNYSDGTFESAGLGKKITGQHKNLVVEDDTSCPDADDQTSESIMPSREDIEQSIGWHRSIYPILIDPMHDEILIILTRWCFYDLYDWIIKNDPGYKIFDRPAIDEKTGKALYPKRFPVEVLEELKLQLGTYRYNALYMNDPRPLDEMVFNPQHTQYYDEIPCEGTVIVSLDPIPPESQAGMGRDYSACIVCLHPTQPGFRGRIYVLDYFYNRYSVPEQIDKTIALAQRYNASRVKVETIFFQIEMAIRLRNKCIEEGISIPIDEIPNVGKSKDHRILGLSPLQEAKALYIRPWMKELENEMYQFVPGKRRFARDDLLDALSMQLPDYKAIDKPTIEVEDAPVFTFESIMKDIKEQQRSKGMRYGFKSQVSSSPYEVWRN